MLLRHIRYFLAVAEHKNFTRAAEALHVSQPTLSQQIRQLEDTLRAPLLDRSGRTIALTDAGVAYLGYARRALQDLEAGRRAIHRSAGNRQSSGRHPKTFTRCERLTVSTS
jgi:LysR family transcriptional regulator, cyn operon transcriptional activator